MRILYCASEANPFCGSGGLADVAGSLPHTLCRKGQDCRIVVPLYGTIPQELKNSMNFITNFTVPVAWRHQYCGLFWARWNDCTYYFIDNEYYFKRGTLYGHYDDAERFAFFSRAILEMLPYIDFHPDIIHCNDWQTALVPVYYYLFYSHRPWYYNIKSLFTIHNIQYQGEYGWEVNTECVGIPASETKILEMNGKLNMMKGAIETATRVSTVSPSYAAEIKDPWFSWGLHDELNLRHYKLCGIKNGIDTESYNPETDYQLYRNYSKDDMSGKGECKRALQERLCLEQRWDVPLVGMVTRLVAHKGLDLVRMGLEDFFGDMDFKVAGTHDGITAIQMDIKIHGLTRQIVEEAIRRTKEAREYILNEVIEKCIPAPRTTVGKYAPKIIQIQIDPQKIGDVVGQRGKTINTIIERTGVKIDITDEGAVSICGVDDKNMQEAKRMVEIIASDFEQGQILTGQVVSIKEFGAFVEFAPGKEGMVHISQ